MDRGNMPRISGFATADGTRRYAQRFPHAASDHFRQRYGLWMSSLGLGGYLGAPTESVSQGYVTSMVAALGAGCNVIDTAPNYRHLRSEQDVGDALVQAIEQGIIQRDEVIVCTKGGYVPYEWPTESRPPDAVNGTHSLDAAFLTGQIRASLHRMGLDCIDIYFVQEPEIQLYTLTPGEFMQRLRSVFETLEEEVRAGRIRFYGAACSHGLLTDTGDPAHLPLYKMVQVAEAVAGANHHFRFLQFPYHLGMAGAFVQANQLVKRQGNKQVDRIRMSLLAAAVQLGMVSITCGGLAQGLLGEEIPEGNGRRWAAQVTRLMGTRATPAQAALHFARSTPGLTTALVSMSTPTHVAENLALVNLPSVDQDRFFKLFE